MMRTIALCLALASSSVCEAALQTNFAGSYCAYLSCSAIQGSSKCYKLYFDPAGIINGRVTGFVEVPSPGTRLESVATLEETHPAYVADILQTSPAAPTGGPGRERMESIIQFSAINQTNPPQDKITIFSYMLGDRLAAGTLGAQAGFIFKPGDFIELYDPDVTPHVTRYEYNNPALQGVIFNSFVVPEPCSGGLAAAAVVALAAWRRRRGA